METRNGHILTGILLASGGSMLWGVSGVIAQTLFENNIVTPAWLTTIRMTLAGLLLLLFNVVRHQDIFAVWRSWKTAGQQIIFGLVGLIPIQYFYFLAVHYGNAAIATILQFLGPIVITVYYVIFHHQLPSRSETIGMVLALLGAFFVVTHGHITHLAVSPALLFWGLMSAVAVATSTLLPRPLLPTFGSVNVNGWGLLIGGVAMNFIQPMWVGVPTLTPKTVLSIGAVVLFGTLIAFVMYSVSLLYITPTTASLMDAFEPLAATVISILVLHTVFTWSDALGGGLIILAVVMLSISYHAPKREED
ncbi:EamA family transporter [Furfurilactobacillus milii]|uniref:EamA family transporter n=1 Tax=Furfurilactobacillus milii TaxID=2888272 RepID=A0A6N9HZH0_9LACO|nr:EamA family transporter [Furfurilactobacillus milii]